MARRASLFERLVDDYSSDSASGTHSDRTTPRLATAIETPRRDGDSRIGDGARSFRDELRHSDSEAGYDSDASYVTVDDEFDATVIEALRDDDVGVPPKFCPGIGPSFST